jgi:hypothetical protein|tara:strand:+ start:1670 stop:1948 length:279 start_codon:yes stop_codon:yes gene_type:complete
MANNTDKTQLKTTLTRDEVLKLLDVFNKFDTGIDSIIECLDVDISTLRDWRAKTYELRGMFNFRPSMDEDGTPNHWTQKVLPDDPTAWFPKG